MTLDFRICPSTGKRAYASREKARRASKSIKNRVGVYRCPQCHGWHVTNRDRSRLR